MAGIKVLKERQDLCVMKLINIARTLARRCYQVSGCKVHRINPLSISLYSICASSYQ